MSAVPALNALVAEPYVLAIAVTILVAVPGALLAWVLLGRRDDDPWADPESWGRQ
jgi:hypothetical protein